VVSPYAAYLRVYEPLTAFRGAERSAWEEYAARDNLPDAATGAALEHRRALAGLIARPPVAVPAHESREAFVLRVDGEVLVCPWETRLRSWAALEELRGSVPDEVLDAFLPEIVLEQTEADFDRWRDEHPGAMPHILTNTWHVPLRWFVPFDAEERVLDGDEQNGRRLYYRTSMAQARRRMARGAQVLRRSFEEGTLVDGVVEVGRWLEEFHPKSHVELDYGGLVHLVDDELLEDDQSAGDVHAALAGLAAGDARAAADAYRRLLLRWRAVQAYEHAS
jgi:hypothetical protein